MLYLYMQKQGLPLTLQVYMKQNLKSDSVQKVSDFSYLTSNI